MEIFVFSFVLLAIVMLSVIPPSVTWNGMTCVFAPVWYKYFLFLTSCLYQDAQENRGSFLPRCFQPLDTPVCVC